jgi:hypothetical protein
MSQCTSRTGFCEGMAGISRQELLFNVIMKSMDIPSQGQFIFVQRYLGLTPNFSRVD